MSVPMPGRPSVVARKVVTIEMITQPVIERLTEITSRRAATLTVTASDSKDKLRTDYDCDGAADEAEINTAIDELPT